MIEAVSFACLFMIFALRKLLWCCTVAWLQLCFACSRSAVHMFCGGSGAKSNGNLNWAVPSTFAQVILENHPHHENQHNTIKAQHKIITKKLARKSAPQALHSKKFRYKDEFATDLLNRNQWHFSCTDVMTSDRQIFLIFFVIVHPISLLAVPIAFESVLASALRPPLAVSEEQITCHVNAP